MYILCQNIQKKKYMKFLLNLPSGTDVKYFVSEHSLQFVISNQLMMAYREVFSPKLLTSPLRHVFNSETNTAWTVFHLF